MPFRLDVLLRLRPLRSLLNRLPVPAAACLAALCAACIAACGGVAGCGSSSSPPNLVGSEGTSLRILPDSASLAPGVSLLFTAEVKDASGRSVSTAIHWRVADTALAVVDSGGQVRGKASGVTRLEARTAHLLDTAVLRILDSASALAAILVAPERASFLAGDREPFFADTRDANAAFVPIAVSWSVADPSVASVDSTGEVTCKSAGSTEVRATADGIVGRATLTVATGPVVSTIAGSGGVALTNGPALQAAFSLPFGLAGDSLGAVYIADTRNEVIRVLENGAVRTLCGGEAGFSDGAAGAAQFQEPTALAVGPGRRVYVADQGNDAIRRIAPDGSVTTLAGQAGSGYQDGPAATARFRAPSAILADAQGNLLVADKGNNLIRKIDSSGNVSTLWGTPGQSGHLDGNPGILDQPSALAWGPDSTLYFCERGPEGSVLRKVTGSPGEQEMVTIAGNGAAGYENGLATRSQLNQPYGLAVGPDGWVYVSDSGNRVLRAVSPSGHVVTVAGSGQSGFEDGPGAQSRWGYPAGMLFRSGELVVADAINGRLRAVRGTLHLAAPIWPRWAVERMRSKPPRPAPVSRGMKDPTR